VSVTPLPHVLAHLGQLHAYEQWLVLLIAFGPFAVLGVVVVVMRRRDVEAERALEGRTGQEELSASQDAPT
jgi:putative exporter of polyketide antibiotics